MRAGLLAAAAAVLVSAVPALAQERVTPQSSGETGSMIRQPSSSNGSSYGTSGNIGAPTSTYPERLRDYNNPAASYGRFGNPTTGNTGIRPNRR